MSEYFEVYYPNKPGPVLIDVDDAEFYYSRKWNVNKPYRTFISSSYKKPRLRAKDYNRTQYANLLLQPTNGLMVDHINGNALDNRRCNLRLVTHKQNTANKTKKRNTSSKYRGVSFCNENNKWYASIEHEKISINLGYFDSEKEAGLAYNKKAKELYGEFAGLNNINN